MLTEIKLTNFKCFKEETSIPLSKFNLFTGINGAGKSTALQALLLMRQSIEYNLNATEVILNGSCVNLGSFDDVKNNKLSIENPIIFEFIHQPSFISHEKFKYYMKPKTDEMVLLVFKVDLLIDAGSHKIQQSYDDPDDEYFPPLFCDPGYTHFISADRIGPQEFYRKSMLSNFPHVGIKGEFTVNLLNKLAKQLVDDSLCLGEDAKTLITQAEAWLGRILNPLKLEVPSSKTNILELFIGNFKPSNVGFGYSSILPIIVTGLIAKPGEKIIIENPEIHLHPKAQSALIEFLIKVANTGVQVFIESHSDHVLNALRIATKNKLITPEDVNILFFGLEDGNSKIIKPTIDENGRIDQWPEYFFDETAKSLASLAAGQRIRIKAPKAED